MMRREISLATTEANEAVPVHLLTNKRIAVVGAAVVILAATILTSLPIPGFWGINAGLVETFELCIATILALVLLWYGLWP